MRSKAIFMALLAFAFGAQAVPVSVDQAKSAARAWARSGTAMGLRLPEAVVDARTHSVAGDQSFFEVKMKGGGTVFVSSDTEYDPIIGFSSRNDLDLSDGSPLQRLLRLDVLSRAALKRLAEQRRQQGTSSTAGGPAVRQESSEQRKWAALLGGKPLDGRMTSGSATGTGEGGSVDPVRSIDDVRVAPLITSKWSQTTDRYGNALYNYYTPDGLPCGCTATAAAQIMRYFRYPTDSMPEQTYACTVEGKATNCTTKAGVYAWDSMPDDPNRTNTDEEREAVGRICYDIAAALGTEWSAKSGGGALATALSSVFKGASFGYGNAFVYSNYSFDRSEPTFNGGLHVLEAREKTIYANLDAKRPVELGIHGYQAGHFGEEDYWSGHAVVGDGYGFKTINGDPVAFVHINMGWAGTDDLWYNIPEVNAANSGAHIGDSGYDFVFMAAVLFNVSPDDTGDILSGRVTDDDGDGFANATVTAELGGEVVATTTTDENGIYAFSLAGGKTYGITARAVSQVGNPLVDARDVSLGRTVGTATGNLGNLDQVGNRWGNDLNLTSPSVRVGDVTFSSLDKALAAARDGDVVEILLPTELKRSCAIGVSCTITSAVDQATDAAVNFSEGATLSVGAPARVLFQNVAFTNAAKNVVITVDAGGTAAVAGYVGVQEFDTADEGGFELAGRITTGFFLDCTGKKKANDVIGRVTADEGELEGCAANIRIRNEYDPDGELGGSVSGTDLVWGAVPVPDDSAVVRLVFDDGTPHRNFMTFATLIKYLTPEVAAIEVCKDCEMTNALTVTKNLTITSSNGLHTVTATNLNTKKTSLPGFTITDGTLTVSNVVFSGYRGESLFVVNGATAGIVLDDGAALENLEGTTLEGSGAIAVKCGSAKLLPGCEIRNCRSQSNGGAIRLADCFDEGVAAHLDLFGGRITGCVAAAQGGGVYVGYGATVDIQGDVVVKDNLSEEFETAQQDNICLCDSTSSAFTLVGELTAADRSVGVYDFMNDDLNLPGETFAAFTTDAAVAAASAPKFFCDIPYGESANVLVGELSEDGASLVWQDGGKGVDPEDANVIVIYPDATTNYFVQVDEALASIESDTAVVELLTDGLTFTGNLVIEKDVTIRSRPGSDLTLTRVGGGAFEVRKGHALTVADLVVDGGMTGEGILFDVKPGAELTLESGASVKNAVRTNGIEGAGIVVDGGTLTMRDGASVSDCFNAYGSPEAEMYGEGAGIWASGSTINLEGGSITWCHATRGGAAAFYDCQVNVSGNVKIQGNTCSSDTGVGFAPNVLVRNTDDIVLAGDFTGPIGVTVRDALGDRCDEVFGRVDASYWPGEDVATLAAAAAKFVYDDTNTVVTGSVVTNGATALLVWSSALMTDPDTEKKYYEDDKGTRYGLIDGDVPTPVIVEPDPIAFESITRVSDTEWTLVVTNIVPFCNYRLLWTKDLTKGFTSTGDWAQAAADAPKAWTTNVVTEGGAWFWRAEGKEGEKPAE